jgi:hypothetical protein
MALMQLWSLTATGSHSHLGPHDYVGKSNTDWHQICGT